MDKKCNDRNDGEKITNFVQATGTNNPTGDNEAISLPPISDSFMYIETSSNNSGDNVFVSWEGTDNIRIIKIIFFVADFQRMTLI